MGLGLVLDNVINMRLRVKIVHLLYCLLMSNACQAERKFTFGVNAPGSPPYLYLPENSTEYRGVIPDLLAEFSESHGYKIKFIYSFCKRTESFVYKGQIDAFLSSEQ